MVAKSMSLSPANPGCSTGVAGVNDKKSSLKPICCINDSVFCWFGSKELATGVGRVPCRGGWTLEEWLRWLVRVRLELRLRLVGEWARAGVLTVSRGLAKMAPITVACFRTDKDTLSTDVDPVFDERD